MGRRKPRDAWLTFYSLHPSLLSLKAPNNKALTGPLQSHREQWESPHWGCWVQVHKAEHRGFPWGEGRIAVRSPVLWTSTTSPPEGWGQNSPTRSHIIRFSWEQQIFLCLSGCPGARALLLITKMCLSAWDSPGVSQKSLCGSKQLPFKVMSF